MSEGNLVVKVATEIRNGVSPLIADVDLLPRIAAVTEHKGRDHTAHKLDQEAEHILFETLNGLGYSGTVFSEESKLVRLGDASRLIVCDPYCNTTITFRGIRESAVAVHEYTLSGVFVSGAIADMQIPRVVWAERNGAFMAKIKSAPGVPGYSLDSASAIHCSDVHSLDEAFVTISMMKRSRRANLQTEFLRRASLINVIDGAIVAARIALGEIDGFVDVGTGQPSYEALAYALVPKAGGFVTGADGSPIDFEAIAEGLAHGQVQRHKIVVAATQQLLDEILDTLSGV